ncbi:MAG: hypothetical protein RI953_2010 [Pseudomonadota bacterium]
MAAENFKLSCVLTISAMLSACSFDGRQTSQAMESTQQSTSRGMGSYLVVDCNEPGSHLVDKSGQDVKTPVRLTVKADKQTLSSISLRAEIPAHISLEDPTRAFVGSRLVEVSDAQVVSSSTVDNRFKQGTKFGIADNQKIVVTKDGQKRVSNLKSLEISESKGADYLIISMELEGASDRPTETVLLSICEMKNTSLLSNAPK